MVRYTDMTPEEKKQYHNAYNKEYAKTDRGRQVLKNARKNVYNKNKERKQKQGRDNCRIRTEYRRLGAIEIF